ncbi:MAG TPA: MarC family protein [Halobacteria archaeon]|jgi:multiple antibiotic resistance protein|nr:MarC family protein [Halobacteria archaeon]
MDIINEFLLAFIPLFIVIDPFASLAVFLTICPPNESQKVKNKLIRQSCTFALILLVLFAFLGNIILNFLGISIYALKITGGILLLEIGMSMLYKGDKSLFQKAPESTPSYLEEIAIVPLGTPMLAGPGAISLVIVLMQTTRWYITIMAIVVTILIAAIMFYLATGIYKLLGDRGVSILTRVLGFLTAALAIEYVLSGLKMWIDGW